MISRSSQAPFGWIVDGRIRALVAAIGSLLLAGILVLALDRPITVVGVLVVVSVGIAVIRFPVAALVLLLFLQPFQTAFRFGVEGRAGLSLGPLVYWKDVLAIALFLRAAAGRLRQDRRLPIRDPGDDVALVYIVVYGVLALASPSRVTVASALGKYVEGALVFLAIRWLRPTRKQLAWCVGAMVAAAATMGAAALYEWVGPQENFHPWYGAPLPGPSAFFTSGGGYRAGAFLYDVLILAFYLAAVIPIAMTLSGLRTRWRPALYLALSCCTAGLIVTFTRSAYIGAAIGALTALALSVRNPRIRISLGGLILTVAGSLAIFSIASGNPSLVRPQSDLAHRESLARDVNLLAERPFGYGLGTTDRFSERVPGGLGATESSFMSKALEGGVQGLGVYLVTLFVIVLRLRKARRAALRDRDGPGVALAAGAIGSILAVSVAGLFLGVQELVVEIVLWGAPAIALTWREPQHPASLAESE